MSAMTPKLLESALRRKAEMGRKQTLDQPQRAHARSPGSADDHMVVHNHLHVATGLDEIAGQADVLLRGRRIAARVVVDDDQRGGSERDGAGDRLANMD